MSAERPKKKYRTAPMRFCAALVIILQFFNGLVPGVSAAPLSSVSLPPPEIARISEMRIPKSMGEITESHQGSQSDTFILVQDAHAIGETQQNIARILRLLEHKYGVRNFAVEGGEGTMDPLLLETVPVRTALKKELQQMVEAGELSGTVPAAIGGESGRQHFFGIEDQGLYEKEIQLYLKNLKRQSGVLVKLKKLREDLKRQKKSTYSSEAYKLDHWLGVLNREPLGHSNLILKILKLGTPDRKRYPALAGLLVESHKEDLALDLNLAHEEWDHFIKDLWDRWVTTTKQKYLRELSLSLERLESLARIRLSAQEWRVLDDRGLRAEITRFEGLDEADFDTARQFYETARARDRIFLNRLIALSQDRPQDGPVVFVSGGFHSDGLKDELRRLDASYLVISPQFSEGLDDNRYESLMRNGQSWNLEAKQSVSDDFVRFHAYLLKRLFRQMSFSQIKAWRDNILRRLAREGRLSESGFYTRIFDANLREFFNSDEVSSAISDSAKRLDSFNRALTALQTQQNLKVTDLLSLFQHQAVSPHDKPLIRQNWWISGLQTNRQRVDAFVGAGSKPALLGKYTTENRGGRVWNPPLRHETGGKGFKTALTQQQPHRQSTRSEVRSEAALATYPEALAQLLQGDYDGVTGVDKWEQTPREVRRRFVLNLAQLKTVKLRSAVSQSQRARADRLGLSLPQHGFKFETAPHQLVRMDFIGETAIKFGGMNAEPEKSLESLYDFYEAKLKALGTEVADGVSHADHVINYMLHDLELDRVERIRQWGRNVSEEKKIVKVTEFLDFLLRHEWDASSITFQPLDFERSVYDLLAHHARFFRSKWVVGHMNNRHFSKYGVQAELGFLTSFFAKGKLGTQFYPLLEIGSVILALRNSEAFRKETETESFNPTTWNQTPQDLANTLALAREILKSKKIQNQRMQTGSSKDLGTHEQQEFRRKYGIILGADLTQRIYSNLFRDDLEQAFYFQHLLQRAYQASEHLEIAKILHEELEEVQDKAVVLPADTPELPDYRIRLNGAGQVAEVWSLHKNQAGLVISEDRHVLLNAEYLWAEDMTYAKFAELVGKKRGLYSALITHRTFLNEGTAALSLGIENSDAQGAVVKNVQSYVPQVGGTDTPLQHSIYDKDLPFQSSWTLLDWQSRAGDGQVLAVVKADEADAPPSEWVGTKSFKIEGKKRTGTTADLVYFKPGALVEPINDRQSGETVELVTLGEIDHIAHGVFGAADDQFYEDEYLLPGNVSNFTYELNEVTGAQNTRAPHLSEKIDYWAKHSGLFSKHFKSRTFYETVGEVEVPIMKIEINSSSNTVIRVIRSEYDDKGVLISQEEWNPSKLLPMVFKQTNPALVYGTRPAEEVVADIPNWSLPVWQAQLKTIADLTKRTWFDETGAERLSLDLGAGAASAEDVGVVPRIILGARLKARTGEGKVFTINPTLLSAVPYQPRIDADRWRDKLEPLLPLFSKTGQARVSEAVDGWVELIQEATMEGARSVYPDLVKYLDVHKEAWGNHPEPQRILKNIKTVRDRISQEKKLLALALSTYQTYLKTGHVTAAATQELHAFMEERIDPALEKWVGRIEGSLSDSWHTILPRHIAFLMQAEILRELQFSDDKLAIMKLFLQPIPASALSSEEAGQFAKMMMGAAESNAEVLGVVEETDEEIAEADTAAPAKPLITLADKLRWALETVSLTENLYKEHLAGLRQLGVDVKEYSHLLAQLNETKTPDFLAGLLERSLFSLKTKAWLSALWTLDYMRQQDLKVSRVFDDGSHLFAALKVKPEMLEPDAEIVDGESLPVFIQLRKNSDSARWNPAPILNLAETAAQTAQQGQYQLVTSFFRLQNQTPEQIAVFLKSAHQLLQKGGRVIITLPAQLNLERAGLVQVKAMGFHVRQGFASNRLQALAREHLLKGRSSADDLNAAARAEAVIYGRGFYVLDLEKSGEAPTADAPFDQLVFTSWRNQVLVRDSNPRSSAETIVLREDLEEGKVLAKIQPQDLEFVPLQERVLENTDTLKEASAEQWSQRVAYHSRILSLIHRYRYYLLRTVKDSRRQQILELLGAFYEDAAPLRGSPEISPFDFWKKGRENSEALWTEPLFATAKQALDTLLNEYVVLSLYPGDTKTPGFDFESLFTDRWAQQLVKNIGQRFADDTYLFEDEDQRNRVPAIFEKWKKAEEPLSQEEIETWLSMRAAMREYHEVLEQITQGKRGLRSQRILESGFSPSLGRDPLDFAAALAAEQILKDLDQKPAGAVYFDMFSGKGVLMYALHDLQESRTALTRRIPNGIDFTLYQADPNLEDLTVAAPGDWEKAAGLVRLEVGLEGLPKEVERLGLMNKIRIMTLINVLHRMNPAEAHRFFLQAAELLQNDGRLLLTLPSNMEMSASMREALFKMGYQLSPPRQGIAQISEQWLDQVEQRVLKTYGDAELARRVRTNVKSTSRRRFSMIELTLNRDRYDPVQIESLSQESFRLDRPVRRKKIAEDAQRLQAVLPVARPDVLRTHREVLDVLHQSDAGGRFQVKGMPQSQLVDRAEAQNLFPEIQSENALEHLYRNRAFFSDPASANAAVRLIEENYDYWRFGTRQFRAGDMQRLRQFYIQGPEAPRKRNRFFNKEELLALAAGHKEPPFDSLRDKLEKQLPKLQDFEVLAFEPGAYAGKALALSAAVPDNTDPSLLHLLQRASLVQPIWSVQRLASLEQFLIQRQTQPGIRRVTDLLRKPPRPVVSRPGVSWTNDIVWNQALEMRETPWQAYLEAIQNTYWAAPALEHLLPFSLYIASLYQLIRDHPDRGVALSDDEYQRVFTQLAVLNHQSREDFTQRLQSFSGSFWIDLQKLPADMQDLIEKINDLEEEEEGRERQQNEGAELGAALHQDYLQIRAFMAGFLSEQTEGFGDYGIRLMDFVGKDPERLALLEAVLEDVFMSGEYSVKRMQALQKTVESQYLAFVYNNPELAFRVIQRMSVLTGLGNFQFGERTHLATFAAARLSDFFDRFGIDSAVKQAFPGQEPGMILARLITNVHLRKLMDTGKERVAPDGSQLLEEMSRLMREFISNAQAPAGAEHAGLLNQMATVKGAPAAFIESLIESRVPENAADQERYFEQIQIYLKEALLAVGSLDDFYTLAARLARYAPELYARARPFFLTWLNFYFHSQEHRNEFVRMLSELNETRVRDWAAILGFDAAKPEDFVNLNEFKYVEEALLEAFVSDQPVAAYQAARLMLFYAQGTGLAQKAGRLSNSAAAELMRMGLAELYQRQGVDFTNRLRLIAGFISTPADLRDFSEILRQGLQGGLEAGSFRHIFYPKIERFFRVWGVRVASEGSESLQSGLGALTGEEKPSIFSDFISSHAQRREAYTKILKAEQEKVSRYHGRQAVTTWLRGHMVGFDREKGRFPHTAVELVNWAAGTWPSFPLEQFPGHMLGGESALNPLMGVVADAFRGFFELNHAIDADVQNLGGLLARSHPDALLYPDFWVWLKDPMNERQEIAMGATFAAIKPDGEAVIYIYTKDHPDPVISSHAPYFYRREVQDLIMALGHMTHDEAFVKRQGFKKARFVLLLEGMDFLRKDRPPLPEGVSLEWVSDLQAAPPSPARIEASFYDPKEQRVVSSSELGKERDYKLADVAQRMHDASVARTQALVKTAGADQRAAEKKESLTSLARLDDKILKDMDLIQWTYGEKPAARRPTLWTLDAEERAVIESFARKILEAPTPEERGLWGNRLERVRRKNFAANVYARFYFVYLALRGAYEPEAVEQGMRSLDHIFLDQDLFEPAGSLMEQALALQDAMSDTALPEGLRLMLQGYFTFVLSHHLKTTTLHNWVQTHPGDTTFGDYLSLKKGVPAEMRDDGVQTQLLQSIVTLARDPDDRGAAQNIRGILKSPTYQQAIIPLLVQYSKSTAHVHRGIAAKMTESKIRPITQIMFEPSVPFAVLIDYFHYALGIYDVWHKQYDYDSKVMRWFLGDLWGEIDRRLGAGEVNEEDFVNSVFGNFWAQDTLIKLLGHEPVVLSRFEHVRKIILKAMTGPDLVLSGRAFNFVSELQQRKAKNKNEGKMVRRLDGDDLLLRDAFVGLFQREGVSALLFQLAYSLAPDSSHVRSIFFHAADAFIEAQPVSEQPVLIARLFSGAEKLLALSGITDFSTMQDAEKTLEAAQKRTLSGQSEIPLKSFSPELRERVHGLVRDIFEAPMKQVQEQLAVQLKRLTQTGPNTVYAEFETSLAILRRKTLAGSSIEQIERAQMTLFQAGLNPEQTVLQTLKPEALQKLEGEFYAARAGRSEDELRDAALSFYYFSLKQGRPYKDQQAEYPLQNQFDADLSLMQAGISEIQEGLRRGNVLQTAGGLYQKVITHYGFQNLEAMKTILHYLRVTHDEAWAELFLKTLEGAIRKAHEAGQSVQASEINGWLMAELANHNWPKRRILKILGMDAKGRTRFDRLIPTTHLLPASSAVQAVPEPEPASAPAARPSVTRPAGPESGDQPAAKRPSAGATVPARPGAQKTQVPAAVKPDKASEMAAILSQFAEVLKKEPLELQTLAVARQTSTVSIAEEFGQAVGFLLLSQGPGNEDPAAMARHIKAFERATRHYESVLRRLETFEEPEFFDQIFALIPPDHPAAWFREETLSPERMLALENMTFGSIQSIPDFFDYLAYDRSRPESQQHSGYSVPITRLEGLLAVPENRQAFREKMRSNYFTQAVWTGPFLYNEELQVFDRNNSRYKNIRETFLEIARDHDPRAVLLIHQGFMNLHEPRTGLFGVKPAPDVVKSLRRFHADFWAESGFLSYLEARVQLAKSGSSSAKEWANAFFKDQALGVLNEVGEQHPGPVREQTYGLLRDLISLLPAGGRGESMKIMLRKFAPKRSEIRHVSDAVLEVLLLDQMPENGMLASLLRVVRDGRVSQLADEMSSLSVGAYGHTPLQDRATATTLNGKLKARLLDRLTSAPAGLEAARPAGLSVPRASVISSVPFVWVSSNLPELVALKTFVRENPTTHVLILLLPPISQRGTARSMRIDQFSSTEFPQIKIAAPKSREAFRRVLRNVPAQFNRTFSSEPVFVLNSEVESRPEFEDISLIADKVIAYNSTWQGSAFLPHHYLLLLDAVKLSQDLDLAYVQQQQTGKSWYRFDERLIDRSLLTDLGQFLTTQLSFTTSA